MQPATKMWEQSLQSRPSAGTRPRGTGSAPAATPCWHRPVEDLGEGAVRSQVALGISTSLPLSHVLGHLVALVL